MARQAIMARFLQRNMGTCLSFNGTSATVDCGDLTDTEGLANITVSAWFKPSFASAASPIVRKRVNAANFSYQVEYDPSIATWTYGVSTGASTANDTGVFRVTLGQWHWACMVYDGANVYLYVDNVQIDSYAKTGSISASTTNMFLASNQGVAQFYPGLIDEVHIYGVALTSDQRNDVYLKGQTTVQPLHKYLMDEGSGTTLNDSGSGTTSNGTITNATYSTDVFLKPRSAASRRELLGTDLNKCINFNLSTSVVTFTAPASFNPGNLTAFTCAAWVQPRGLGGGSSGRICDFGNLTAGKGWLINVGSAGYNVSVALNPTSGTVTSGIGTIKIGEWQRVLCTWDDANNFPSLYLDGTSYAATTTNKGGSRVNISGDTIQIGNRSGSDRAFNGLIDEFCVWNRVLTTDEIAADFCKMEIPSSGLILRYKMDEASGALTDSSASGLTGTASNVTQNVISLSRPARVTA